jgi:atypical dual specificity phosphatase
MTPIFDLDRASLHRGSAQLGPLDLTLRAEGVTVLLGPVATGKSTLLRALAGALEPEWSFGGRWRFRGGDVTDQLASATRLEGVRLRPQRTRVALDMRERPDDILGDPARDEVLLLDEPERQIAAGETPHLASLIRARADRAAVIVVTHDLTFARSIADDVCLLAAGAIVACAPAHDFFERPASGVVAKFLRQGNCWPVATYEPPLPNHFHWVLPGSLGGMAYPGMFGEEEEELEAIARAGVEILVTTTHDPFPRDRLRAFGIEGRHLPIRDMGVPAERHVASLCAGLDRAFAANRGVAIHCKAGLGRTGLVLASILTWRGTPGPEAITTVRAVEPKYIQTPSQEDFVLRFAEMVHG